MLLRVVFGLSKEGVSLTRISVRVKAGFGEVVLEGDSPQEVLDLLRQMPKDFVSEVEGLVSARLVAPTKTQLQGIVELTTGGPIITTREKLTHYEAIGLTLYASEGKTNTATQIGQLLASCGVKAMVPARLNEMTKRGLVFKPDSAKPDWRLTTQGERGVEEEVGARLRGAGG